MAAWHHLNTDQSGYWLDPEYHVANLKHSVDKPFHGNSMSQLWQDKEAEARTNLEEAPWVHGAGIYDSLMAGDPIRKPVEQMYNPSRHTSPTQDEGHHRIAAAAAVQKETGRQIRVPVKVHGLNTHIYEQT